uniref:PHD-type domain-containing protein n=1 Tax=Cynoglossus semilaevis TaxID=244447 RepID=A0A3P8UIT1_CYNSE
MCLERHLPGCSAAGQKPRLVPEPQGPRTNLLGHRLHQPIRGTHSTRQSNTMDLGDLHGPYYPEGYQPSTKRPANASGLKEDDSSDSDSSSCSPSGGIKRRKCAPPPTSWSFRAGAQLQSKGRPENQRWSDATDSPLAKPARSDSNGAAWDDWYSPPLLPQEPCEYWLHEDCGIWSAGVFLVKGKVYGLEEALKLICHIFQMCSACQDPGATLGCFFKGCSNKYHYRCALKSGTSHCQSAG